MRSKHPEKHSVILVKNEDFLRGRSPGLHASCWKEDTHSTRREIYLSVALHKKKIIDRVDWSCSQCPKQFQESMIVLYWVIPEENARWPVPTARRILGFLWACQNPPMLWYQCFDRKPLSLQRIPYQRGMENKHVEVRNLQSGCIANCTAGKRHRRDSKAGMFLNTKHKHGRSRRQPFEYIVLLAENFEGGISYLLCSILKL